MTAPSAPPPGLAAPRHITYVRLSALRPAVRNPRIHGAEQVARLRQMIERVGFTQPCLIDERTERLIAGHGRLETLGQMLADAQPAPDGLLIDDDGEWLVPVIRGWASRDDVEADAVVVWDNRANELGDWHFQTLAAVLEDVQTADVDLFDSLAYSAEQLDEVLRYTSNVEIEGQAPGSPDVEHALNAAGDPLSERDADHAREDLEMDGDGTTEESATPRSGVQTQCPACHHRFTVGDRAWD